MLLAACATGLGGLRHRSYNVGLLFPGILLTVRTIRANRGGYFRTVSCVSLEQSPENILSSTVIEAIARGNARASVYVRRRRKEPRVSLPTSIGSTEMSAITVTENVHFEIARPTFFMNYDLKMFVDRYQALRKDLLRETTYS